MGLTELENEHDQLFQPPRILAYFGDDYILVDQMIKEQGLCLVAEFGVDLRWGIHDAKQHEFIDREHGVGIGNSSLYIETIIHGLAQSSPLDSRIDSSKELADWCRTLGKWSERVVMLALVIVLDHRVILRHRLVLEIANIQIGMMVLYDAVNFLLLQLIESVVISLISILEFVIGFFYILSFQKLAQLKQTCALLIKVLQVDLSGRVVSIALTFLLRFSHWRQLIRCLLFGNFELFYLCWRGMKERIL